MLRNIYIIIRNLWPRFYNFVIFIANRVVVGQEFTVNGCVYVNNRGSIEIGDGVTINSGMRLNPVGGQTQTRIIVYPGAKLRIGNNVGISNTTIVVQSSVEIDDGAIVGGSCNILDTDFHSLNPNVRGTVNDIGKTKPVYIGKKVFLGAHSIVLKGVSIEDYSIIGAGSVIRQIK